MNRKTVAGCAASVEAVYLLPCRSENGGIASFEPPSGNAPARLGVNPVINIAADVTSNIVVLRTVLITKLIDIIPASTFLCML